VSLTSPTSGATFTAPASITLTATAADSDGTIQKVDFFHGGTNLIATVTTPPYTFTWTGVTQGSYTLTAVATDNLNAATTSAPVNITVDHVPALHFVQVDHLNTPRLVADATGTTVWKWDELEPFGNSPADENPSGLGLFDLRLRFPGQYFDKETNLAYNLGRDYDAGIGRYTEFDPAGLRGGVNPYAYVDGNPLSWFDPDGNAKKYQKPPNPNRRKGAEERQQTGERERNVKPKGGEEHSRRPKGGFRNRSICVPFLVWSMVQEFCRLNPGAMECLVMEPQDPDDLYGDCPKDNPYCA